MTHEHQMSIRTLDATMHIHFNNGTDLSDEGGW